ncbi:MAG: hypothetical protein C0504_02620 [Candidatus Solibacter sp.]|nr:hypothetical protein [Candidatus Solibacter sp.]
MKLGNMTVVKCALAGALMMVMAGQAMGQPVPDLMRISYYKVKAGGTYDFAEGIKLVNEAYKKQGTPWRRAWATTIFGQTYTGVLVTPVRNFAQFDSPGPMAGMSTADNLKFQTLMRSAVEESRHVLARFAPELSITSGPLPEKTHARMMTTVVKPGKALEFEEMIKTMLLPALKQAGIKDYRVNRVMLGSAVGEYIIVTPFAKWAEMDAMPTTEKILGASYKAYMAKVAETVDRAETQSMTTTPELGYVTQ